MSKYVVYRHRRLDTNEIFYIGIGSYKRANSRHSRNKHWKNIFNSTIIAIEILMDNATLEEASELEILLISEYGRRDLNTGSLVNMTNGGEGNFGYTPSKKSSLEHSKRMRGEGNPNYGKFISEEQKQKTRKTWSENKSITGGKNCKAKLVLDAQTGIFFDCVKDASEAYSINHSTLRSMMQGRRKNRTNLVYC